MTATARSSWTRCRLVLVVLAVVLLGLGGTAAALAAAGGNGQGNNGVGNGNGGSAGTGTSVSPGKAFTVSVQSVSAIAPGKTGTVTVNVTNPNSQAANLTSLTGIVTGVGSGTRAGLPKCEPSWVVLGGWTGTRNVAGNGSTALSMPVSFTDKPTTNQDNCKGVTYTFSFVVNGQQA
jgi:hypothetical protein